MCYVPIYCPIYLYHPNGLLAERAEYNDGVPKWRMKYDTRGVLEYRATYDEKGETHGQIQVRRGGQLVTERWNHGKRVE